MTRSLNIAIAALLSVMAFGSTDAVPTHPEFNPFVEIPGERLFSGRLIARPVQPAGDESVYADLAARYDAAQAAMRAYTIHAYIPQTDEFVFDVPPGESENSVAQTLLASGCFEYVQPDWIVFPLGCPNDPGFGNQWHHAANRMNSCLGWDIETGGAWIGIGICDTGVRVTHEDLQLNRLEGYNAPDNLWESHGGDITDINGHGTATTGCAAANGNNGKGVAGTNWNISHRMLRVTNSGDGTASISNLTLAARTSIEAGDRVASVSYSGVDSSTVVTTAAYIRSLGGILVWAAGNDSRDLTYGNRDDDKLIVVGATNSNDNKAGFSAYGIFVDLVAPGVDIYTTSNSGNSAYGGATGTSFATPLTAGLVALIWSEDPDLSANEVEQILKAGTDDLGPPGVDNTYGYGRIEVKKAMDLALNALDFDFPNGLPDAVDPAGGTSLRVQVLAHSQQPQPGTGEFHYNLGSGWVTVPMQVVSANVYDAVFPAVPCGSEIQYYVSARSVNNVLDQEPRNAPARTLVAVGAIDVQTLAEYDFESSSGWIANNANLSAGYWQRVAPTGAQGALGDPPADYDGSGMCWVTGNGYDDDVDGGPAWLYSPLLNLASAQNPYLRYARWFTNDDGDDRLNVEVSNNGGITWTLVESVQHSPGWVVRNWRLGDFVSPSMAMQIRFIVSDNPNNSRTEAAIDAVVIRDVTCDVAPPCPADLDGDGAVGQGDLGILLGDFNCAGGSCAGDVDGDGDTDQGDLGVLLSAFGQPCP